MFQSLLPAVDSRSNFAHPLRTALRRVVVVLGLLAFAVNIALANDALPEQPPSANAAKPNAATANATTEPDVDATSDPADKSPRGAAAAATKSPQESTDTDDQQAIPPWGYLMEVSLPLSNLRSQQLIRALETLAADNSSEQSRLTVVLHFSGNPNRDGAASVVGGTRFEDALMFARFLTNRSMRHMKTVAYLDGVVDGHAVLPVLACDQIIVQSQSRLGPIVDGSHSVDDIVRVAYDTIAARRRTLPAGVVSAMLDPDLELVRVHDTQGRQQFLSGDALNKLRSRGEVWNEEPLSEVGSAAEFTGAQLRQFRWATHELSHLDQAPDALGLQGLRKTKADDGPTTQAILAEVVGPIHDRRIRRLMGNVSDAIRDGRANYMMLAVDSAGGDFQQAVNLSLAISQWRDSAMRSATFVKHQALGDAALVALSAEHVYMAPGARLGGPGNANLSAPVRGELSSLVTQLARTNRRDANLIQGLVDSERKVYEYADSRTGRIAYFTLDQVQEMQDAQRWIRKQRIELDQGIDAERALQLGLIDAIVPDLKSACERELLPKIPDRIHDRALVRMIESLGRQVWIPRLLLFIGFFMFSVEMGAPGIGVSGFVSLCCVLLFFWISIAGGTAEWLEVLLFAGGVTCIICEIFLIPGFGIFGIGGFVMIVSSLILASQTFVLPNNPHQYEQLSRSLAGVLIAVAGVVLGAIMLRLFFPQLPWFRHLVMSVDPQQRHLESQREELVHWDHLLGQQGQTTTPLVPAGKARFGDEVVAVLSEGRMIDPGKTVIVKSVHGNRVLVAEI